MLTTSKPTYKVQYGTTTIEFTVSFKKRKTLAIQVFPDLHVHVIAPLDTQHDLIEKKIIKRGSWILTQQRYFYQLLPLPIPRVFESGETHCYLGKRYRLKVVEACQKSVKLKGQYIIIETPDKANKKKIETQLIQWYKVKAQNKFEERLHQSYQLLKSSGIPFPIWQIRNMQKRWGSCTASAKILLNLHLIKAPLTAIDYVIVHELCHLKHPHHNTAFYNMLTYYMPDWDKRRKQLEKVKY